MITTPRCYAIHYRLDGINYVATVSAWNELEARELLANRLAPTLAALDGCPDYRVLSVTC